MGKELDLDDVAHGNPLAERELKSLRAALAAAEEQYRLEQEARKQGQAYQLELKARAESAEARAALLEGLLRECAEHWVPPATASRLGARIDAALSPGAGEEGKP